MLKQTECNYEFDDGTVPDVSKGGIMNRSLQDSSTLGVLPNQCNMFEAQTGADARYIPEDSENIYNSEIMKANEYAGNLRSDGLLSVGKESFTVSFRDTCEKNAVVIAIVSIIVVLLCFFFCIYSCCGEEVSNIVNEPYKGGEAPRRYISGGSKHRSKPKPKPVQLKNESVL